jgi:hypothetical protein
MGPPTTPDTGPIRFRPIRTEPRGDRPAHSDRPPLDGRPFPAGYARLRAWARLEEWRRDHG